MNTLRVIQFVWQHPLNRGRRLAALGRLGSWQVRSRLGSGAFPVPFVNGTRLSLRRGMVGATGNWYCGLHEPDEMGFVLHTLQRGEWFADVGANVGTFSMLAGGGCGARVIAFEPTPTTFQYLVENIELNGLAQQVTPINAAVGAQQGSIRFSADHDAMNHVIAETGNIDQQIEVPLVRLDDALGGQTPSIIKIDVEGFEGAVLEGAANTLRDPRLLALVMENPWAAGRYGYRPEQLLHNLQELGFVAYHYDALHRALTPPTATMPTTAFIRDVRQITDRIAAAPRFRLCNGTI